MKNFYDLTRKERHKYYNEFKKTNGCKDFLQINLVLCIIWFVMVIVDLLAYNPHLSVITGVYILICFMYSIYIDYNFLNWYRDKYNENNKK